MDVVTLALAKGGAKSYTDQAISSLGAGFTYKGSVATIADLPSSATAGDEYTVGNLGAYVYDGSEWKQVSPKIGTGNLILKSKNQTLATFNANSSENVEVVLPSGEGGEGLPDVEGSGKALVSIDGEWRQQSGYGYEANDELVNITFGELSSITEYFGFGRYKAYKVYPNFISETDANEIYLQITDGEESAQVQLSDNAYVYIVTVNENIIEYAFGGLIMLSAKAGTYDFEEDGAVVIPSDGFYIVDILEDVDPSSPDYELYANTRINLTRNSVHPIDPKFIPADIKKECVRAIKVINQSITLGEVNTLLNTINTAEEHVFFDVSALGAKMYLCTISIDTTADTYTIFDLVLGRTASGVYESSKLLTMAIAQATTIATQKQIDHLQEEIDELGGSERIKNLEQLGNLIESGDSPNLISAGDSITFNWVKTVLGTTTHGLTVTCSDEDLFINGIGECEEKDYLLVYDGSHWTYNEEVVDLADFGLAVSGTPQSGEVMTVNVTVDQIEYVFTGYDDMTPHSSAVPHNWLMEQKYAPSTKTLDAEEALFAVYAGKNVPAGNYHLRRYCYLSSFNIDCYFTLASALGDASNIIQACYNTRATGQKITNADGVTKTGVAVVSKLQPKVYKTGASAGTAFDVTYAPADGVEYTDLDSLNVEGEDPVVYLGSFDKTVYGNNQYENSNMAQWLNDDTKGDSYEPSYMCDTPCSYNRGKGFLWGLDPRVKALILDCDIKCIAGYENIGHERNSYYDVTTKVFLLSMKEMSFNVNTGEGNVTDLYNEYTEGVLHNNACDGRAKYNKAGGTLNSYRWARTALTSHANISYNFTSAGANSNGFAYYGYFCAPAFIIGKPSSNI